MVRNELQQYASRYFDDCILRRRLSDKTIKAYTIDLQHYFEFIGEGGDVHQNIIEFIHELNRTYKKPKTIKRKIASVKAFYSYLAYEGVIEVTPFHNIRTQIKEPKLLPKIISSDTICNIFQILYEDITYAQTDAKKQSSMRNAAVIELLFTTGIRISELCELKKENINFKDKTILIYGKGAKERLLYLGNDDVLGILIAYQQVFHAAIDSSGYFFVNRNGNRLSEQSVRFMLKKMEERLHLSMHITPHMFRHTYATQLLERDVDIRYIQKILGHSSISITQIYTYVAYPKQREIMTLKNPRNDIHIHLK